MIYKFNKIEVNVAKRTLMLDGESLKAQPKVFDLLVFLIENRQRAVSKEEIQDHIWSNLEVSETALTRAIMKARKLIQDSGDVIKTVHGHGYHFVADVESVSAHPVKVQNAKPQHSWFAPMMVVVILALIGVSAIQLFKSSDIEAIRIAVLPIKDQTQDADLGWVSMGLMSLATQMIKAENTVDTVSARTTASLDVNQIPEDLVIPEVQQKELKNTLDSSHLLVSRLSKNTTGPLTLFYKVYHPDGASPMQQLSGDNPTLLVQKMTRSIIATLPGTSTSRPFKVISDDVFTNELYSRGMAFQIKGDAKKARDYFKLASEEDPSLFWPRYELALTTRKLGLHEDAKQELLKLWDEKDSLTQDPGAIVGLLNALGQVESLLGHSRAALTYYKKAFAEAEMHQLYQHQGIAASNVGMAYKRIKENDQARSWIARSIEINEKNKLQTSGYNFYQLAQIERNTGDLDKALLLFEKSLNVFRDKDELRFVAAVLSSMARIYGQQGFWKKAHTLLDESLELRTQLSDPLGVIDTHLTRMDIYIAEGRYQETQKLIEQTRISIEEINNKTRLRYIQRSEIMLMFKQGLFEELGGVFSQLEKQVFNSNIRSIELKVQHLNGNSEAVEAWLQKYKENESEHTLGLQLMYWDMRAFIAEHNGDSKRLDYLRKAVDISRQMGLYATMADHYLIMADHHLAQEHVEEARKIFDNLSLYSFHWWQIDLLAARLAFAEGNMQQAVMLANQARTHATESWSPQHQHIYDSIINN